MLVDWQPMETAPKDGTPFLAMVDGKREIIVGDKWGRWHFAEREAEHTRDDFFGDQVYPARWMPLPEPPIAKSRCLDVEKLELVGLDAESVATFDTFDWLALAAFHAEQAENWRVRLEQWRAA